MVELAKIEPKPNQDEIYNRARNQRPVLALIKLWKGQGGQDQRERVRKAEKLAGRRVGRVSYRNTRGAENAIRTTRTTHCTTDSSHRLDELLHNRLSHAICYGRHSAGELHSYPTNIWDRVKSLTRFIRYVANSLSF
jgi:hypothetical protein